MCNIQYVMGKLLSWRSYEVSFSLLRLSTEYSQWKMQLFAQNQVTQLAASWWALSSYREIFSGAGGDQNRAERWVNNRYMMHK